MCITFKNNTISEVKMFYIFTKGKGHLFKGSLENVKPAEFQSK